VIWANVFLGKCLSGQMSFWANAFWANVFLANVFWANVVLGKCRSGQMSLGKCLWANVGSPGCQTILTVFPRAAVADSGNHINFGMSNAHQFHV
jgi:hypothetical protein